MMIAYFCVRQLDLVGAKFNLFPATHWLCDSGRSLNLSEPLFPHLRSGEITSPSLALRGGNREMREST